MGHRDPAHPAKVGRLLMAADDRDFLWLLPPTPFFTALKESFNEAEALLANCTPEEIAQAERELDGDD
jgi:hypothetical protein